MLQVTDCVFVVIRLKDGEGLNQSNGTKGGVVNRNAEDLVPDQIWQVWEKPKIIPRFLILVTKGCVIHQNGKYIRGVQGWNQ